jgi:uncharacterized protein (DUF952 family)
MASDDSIYHLVEHGPWIDDKLYAPPSLQTEGFIHLSTKAQLLGTVARFFAHTESVLLVEVRPGLLDAELRYEEADGAQFPHLFGPLNPEAVMTVHTMRRGPSGAYELPTSL